MAFVTSIDTLSVSSWRLSTSTLPNRCKVQRSTFPFPSPSSSPLQRQAVQRQTPQATAHKVREVSAEELEIALQDTTRPLLVDAYAKWCGPCQFLIPELDIVAEKFSDRLDILKFDTEKHPKLASALQIRGLPTLFFIKDAQLRYRMEGAMTADQLGDVIEYILFDGPPPKFAPQHPDPAKA